MDDTTRTASSDPRRAARSTALVTGRVTLAPRIGAGREHPVLVDRDGLGTPGDLGPLAEDLQLVALRGQPLAHLLAEARLDLEGPPGFVEPPRCLDGLLDAEPVIDEADGELEVRLHLGLRARRPVYEPRRGALEDHDGVEGVHRTLAGREHVGRAGIEREAGEPIVEEDAGARDHRRRAEQAEDALDERDGG